mgnify:CR=1 FL=1|tara:strand:+ start:95 stop:700 length:606 start_codon:yes stop_codon:yes gene_type:complete
MALNFANNNSLSAITSIPASISGGAMTLLQTQTASSSSTIDFTSNIDSTYKIYIVKFYDVHPSAQGSNYFQVNFRDGGSSFDAIKTTTLVRTYHFENDSTQAIAYEADHDLQQSTGSLKISQGMSTDNDHCTAGTIKIYAPSDTTFVKHFFSDTQTAHEDDASYRWIVGGYCNTNNAIDGLQFSMSSGNIDTGTFKLFGLS